MVSHLEGPVSNLYPLNIFFIGQLITGKEKRGREPGGLYFICLIEGLLWGSQSLLIIYLREVVYFILFCFIIFYDTGAFLENRTLHKRLWQGHLKHGVRAFASMESSQDTLGTCIFLSPCSAPLFGTRFPPWIIFYFSFIVPSFVATHLKSALTARGTNCNLIVFLSEVKPRDHNICLCPLCSCKARLTFKGKRNYFDLVLGLERAEGNHDDGEPQTPKK